MACLDDKTTEIEDVLVKIINDDFGMNGKLLVSQLRPNKIIVTGGIIQALINNTKDYGDLDIVCCDEESYIHFTKYMNSVLNMDKCQKGSCVLYFGDKHIQSKAMYTEEPKDKSLGNTEYCISEKKQKDALYHHDYGLTHNDNCKQIYELRGLSLINHVDNYIINGKCLQIITLNKSDIMKFIGSFDLDICRNYFNGTELYCENVGAIKAKQMTLYRYKNKEGHIVDSLLNERTTERLEKYKKRGYKLIREIYDYIE